MTTKMLSNDPIINLTKGEQNRDFLYVSDLLTVYDLVIKNMKDFTNYEEFIIGSGTNINLKYILEYIKKETASISILKYGAVPYRHEELMNSNNDISKIKKLGWNPKISIEEGLNKVINFMKKNEHK